VNATEEPKSFEAGFQIHAKGLYGNKLADHLAKF